MQISVSRVFVICLLGLLVISTLCLASIYWGIYGYSNMFGDFHVFHDAARHAVMRQWSDIYDVERLRSVVKHGIVKELSFFLNPPTGLLLIYPLGFLTAAPALALWTTVQLALLYAVLRMDDMQRLFAPSVRPAINTNVLLIIPFIAFSLLNFLYGQVAVLCTALFLLVFLWRKPHPVMAGIVLGIFSFKPQLGVLLPLLLLAEKNWVTLTIAAISACTLTGLSVLIFGAGLWRDYHETVRILGYFLAKDQSDLFAITTSVYAAFRSLGAPANLALGLQAVTAFTIAFWIWPVLRGKEESHKILMLALATYLVTPYSLVYDMPLIALPVAFLLHRTEVNAAAFPELITLVLLILIPLVTILLQIMHIPYSVIAIGLALIVARKLILKEQRG
jgi:hypothetical protein